LSQTPGKFLSHELRPVAAQVAFVNNKYIDSGPAHWARNCWLTLGQVTIAPGSRPALILPSSGHNKTFRVLF
jgi:hypothetical protein